MITNVVQREVVRLEEILKNGLPACYKTFDQFLFDFFPDFSWNQDSLDEYAALLADTEWCALAEQVKAKYGYDFKEEIILALNDNEEPENKPPLSVKYIGRDALKRRSYDVQGAVVTAINEEEWEYKCSTCEGHCSHIMAVQSARSEFEEADSKMGDPNP